MKRNINDDWSQEDLGIQNPEFPKSVTNRKSSSTGGVRNGSAAPTRSKVDNSQLLQLFENELKDLYWAEKALTTAFARMVKYADSNALASALESHLDETSEHVTRLEDIFEMLGKNPVAKKCEGMEGLIKEAGRWMDECEGGPMRDAAIISAAQKIAHYEIAAYGTLRQFAETLELREAESLLAATLEEEKTADEKLTEIAIASGGVNQLSKKS